MSQYVDVDVLPRHVRNLRQQVVETKLRFDQALTEWFQSQGLLSKHMYCISHYRKGAIGSGLYVDFCMGTGYGARCVNLPPMKEARREYENNGGLQDLREEQQTLSEWDRERRERRRTR